MARTRLTPAQKEARKQKRKEAERRRRESKQTEWKQADAEEEEERRKKLRKLQRTKGTTEARARMDELRELKKNVEKPKKPKKVSKYPCDSFVNVTKEDAKKLPRAQKGAWTLCNIRKEKEDGKYEGGVGRVKKSECTEYTPDRILYTRPKLNSMTTRGIMAYLKRLIHGQFRPTDRVVKYFDALPKKITKAQAIHLATTVSHAINTCTTKEQAQRDAVRVMRKCIARHFKDDQYRAMLHTLALESLFMDDATTIAGEFMTDREDRIESMQISARAFAA